MGMLCFWFIFFIVVLLSLNSNGIQISLPFRSRFSGLGSHKTRPALAFDDGKGTNASDTFGETSRDVSFWGRAIEIYSSYKIFQLKRAASNMFNNNCSDAVDAWNEIHEINSQRMVKLCLDLRGFYLKTGQFLGTRHDFMPPQYTSKLGRLHDNVPPLGEDVIKEVLENELNGPVVDYFTTLDLSQPIGSASVAQVHEGVWKATGEKVAVKIQYPNAERLMTGDLRNLRALAEFLQRTELKFDILSAIKELQKQIKNEFNFVNEAKNMDNVRMGLAKNVPEVTLPRSIFCTKKVLVMSFVEGKNLCRLAEFKEAKQSIGGLTSFAKKKLGKQMLDVLAKAWAEQIFVLRLFNADPHPGNICLHSSGIGLLDWGQVKRVSDELALKLAIVVEALNSRQDESILLACKQLGLEMANMQDESTVAKIVTVLLDTRVVPGYVMDPFSDDNMLKSNPVTNMPPDIYFVVRTVQLFRGIACGFDIDFSVAAAWAPYARKVISESSSSMQPVSVSR